MRTWMRLGVVALVLFVGGLPLASTGSALAQVTAAVPADERSDQEAAIEAQLFVLMNQSRAAAGLAPLTRNASLDAAADQWSRYMAAGNCPPTYFPLCHRSRESMKAIALAAAPQGVRWWAENVQIRWANAEASHAFLMASPGHRANIMRPATNTVGIGVVILDSGYMLVTQEFVEAKPLPPPPHPCGKLTSTLAYGSRGTSVKVLQCALTQAGVFTGAIDGRFGVSTRAAVRLFQQQQGLKVTGTSNTATRKALGFPS